VVVTPLLEAALEMVACALDFVGSGRGERRAKRKTYRGDLEGIGERTGKHGRNE
jgi:hypothetical protein